MVASTLYKIEQHFKYTSNFLESWTKWFYMFVHHNLYYQVIFLHVIVIVE